MHFFHFKSGFIFKNWKRRTHSTAFNEDPKYENNQNLISSLRNKHVETDNDEFPSHNFFYALSTNNVKKLLPYRKLGMATQHITLCS